MTFTFFFSLYYSRLPTSSPVSPAWSPVSAVRSSTPGKLDGRTNWLVKTAAIRPVYPLKYSSKLTSTFHIVNQGS